MSGEGVGGAQGDQVHPNVRLLEAFYQAQAAFYAGGDDTAALRGLLTDDIVWHVPRVPPKCRDVRFMSIGYRAG